MYKRRLVVYNETVFSVLLQNFELTKYEWNNQIMKFENISQINTV